MYDWYGVADTGIIAAEGPEQDGLYVWEDAHYVEIVDPDSHAPRPDGEPGNMCVTALFKDGVYPIVRFDTNDVSSFLAPARRPAASRFRRIRGFQGRSDQMVKLRGINVYPTAIGVHLGAHPAPTGEFVCRVERRGARDELTVIVEVRAGRRTRRSRVGARGAPAPEARRRGGRRAGRPRRDGGAHRDRGAAEADPPDRPAATLIITQKGNDNIFLTSFSQDIGMAKIVRWLPDDLKAEKIALVWVNNAFGKGGRDMFVQFLKERGKAPVVDIATEVQQADFTPELTKVRASGATHVMVYNHEEENARFMIQLRKMALGVEPVGETTSVRADDHHARGRRGQRRQVPRGAHGRRAVAPDGRHEPALPGEVQPGARPQRLQGLYRRPPPQGRRPARGVVGPGQGARVPAR